MSYKDTRIIDFIEFNPKLTLKKGTIARKIPMESLAPFTRDVYSNTYEPYNGGAKFQNNDTIVARITPSLENGKTAYINHLNNGEIAFGSTEFIVLRAKSGVSYPQFVYYFATSTLFRDNAIASMTGTSGRQRVQENTLYDLIYRLPSLKKQKAIANILSSLDDKIELNNKINKNLEVLAQTLYKRWFVDFEFPNEDGEPYKSSGGEMVESELGLIPNGWQIKTIFDIADTVLGGTPSRSNSTFWGKGHQWLKSGELNNLRIIKGTESITDLGLKSSATKLMPIGTTLIAITGYVGIISMLEIEACANQSVVGVIPNDKYPRSYIFGLIKEEIGTISSNQTGSAQQHINKNDINSHRFICPTEQLIKQFCSIVESLNKNIAINLFENQKLSQLRDELLPKLMNGEIEVPIEE